MTLLYKLMGNPQTFEELVDKVKRVEVPVNIGMRVNCVDEEEGLYGIWTSYDFTSMLKIGRTSLRLSSYSLSYLTPYDNQLSLFDATAELLRETDRKREFTEAIFLTEAVRLAETIRKCRSEPTINGKLVGEAKERLKKLRSSR